MLVILSGVSGAGKDTIKKELIKRMEEVESLPSFTSRNPRVGEEEGIQYHFITKEQFEEKIKNNEFYEYDLHHENYYGTSRKLMNDKIQSGKIIVKDIEVNGTENLVKLLKEDTKIVTIFFTKFSHFYYLFSNLFSFSIIVIIISTVFSKSSFFIT